MSKISVNGLTKEFDGKKAVDDVSFCIEKGSLTALLGPNGAGKTTTVNMLSGLLLPTSGQISYNEINFSGKEPDIKRIIGVVPQHNNVDRDLTIYENLLVHSVLFGMKDRVKEKINKSLEFAGLTDHKNKKAGKLSGGMKRRLVIARALLHEPQVLFLDEPTTGLDASVRRVMWDFIKTINREKGCTIILTTHYIEEAENLSDRVMVMDRAKIVADGNAEGLKKDVGRWAVDVFENGETKTTFFEDREDAVKMLGGLSCEAGIRETNLEDVYLNITGRRIEV